MVFQKHFMFPTSVLCVAALASNIASSDTVKYYTTSTLILFAALYTAQMLLVSVATIPAPLPEPKKSYALVTGASSGIGKDIATELARRGFNLVLVARSIDALVQLQEELCGTYSVEVKVISLDLAQPDCDTKLSTQLADTEPVLWFNNAGFAHNDWFADAPGDRLTSMIQLNVTATTMLTQMAVKYMVPRGYGRICNVSSVCGMNPTPNEAVYGATKAYLNSLGQSISYELVGTGVTMTTVCPGATITNFTKAANCEDALVFSLTFVPQLCSTSKYMAETSVKAALRGEVMVVAPTLYHVLCTMSESVLPIWFTLWMNCVVFKPAPSLRDISDGLKNAFWRTPKAKAL